MNARRGNPFINPALNAFFQRTINDPIFEEQDRKVLFLAACYGRLAYRTLKHFTMKNLRLEILKRPAPAGFDMDADAFRNYINATRGDNAKSILWPILQLVSMSDELLSLIPIYG